MGLMDILQQYAQGQGAQPTADTATHFDTVATSAPPDALGSGITAALRGTPGTSFASSVEQLFGNSNPDQRAGILQQLIASVEPAVLSSIAGGALARFLPGASGGAVPTAQEANAITPSQAGELASAAQQRDPGVIDRVGSFYAQHPAVFKALGAAALAIAMSHMANRSSQ
jgi:hypothetical protein